jgi:hypothetical protein
MFGSIAVHSQQHHITNSTPSWPGSQDITTKLQSLPVLRCNNVELFYERGLEKYWRDSWTPRRYQTTCQFSRSGTPPRVRAPQVQRHEHLAFLSDILDNFGLYSNIQTLTREVVAWTQPHQVVFHRISNTTGISPLSTIDVAVFHCLFHDSDVQSIPQRMVAQILVKGEDFCAFHCMCTEPPCSNSRSCVAHHVSCQVLSFAQRHRMREL